jgi:hypothetical protein
MRRDFVIRFMRECGVTYAQACQIYETMCRCVEDGVVSGSKIRLGRVGVIVPVWRQGRDIHMHFKVEKGRTVKRGIHRTYNMDGRFVFKFELYQKFIETHQLKWFRDFPELSESS